jgi:hypothetical protein
MISCFKPVGKVRKVVVFLRKVGLFLKDVHKIEFLPFAVATEGGDEASIFRVARDEKALRKKLAAQK